MKKFIIATFIGFIFITACKKTTNPTTDNLTLSNEALAGKYTTTDLRLAISGIDLGSIYDTAFKKDCQKLSINNFTAGGNYTYFDSCKGTTTAPSTYYTAAPNTLIYNGKSYLVQSLTTTKLVISFDSVVVVPTFGSQNATFKVTLTRQP